MRAQWRRGVLGVAALLWACLPASADPGVAAPDEVLAEQHLVLPGDPDRPVTLEVTLFTPPGTGPFPLAVMNHGADSVSAEHRGPAYRYSFPAYYFLSRGYAVALPMARGFAGSGGALAVHGCALDQVGLANARDLRAVIASLRGRPGIDGSRVVVAGESFGAWTGLALGALNGRPEPAGLRGVVAFAPALRASDCPFQDAAMIDGAAHFGAASRMPALWFYGDNDALMPQATWQAMFDGYRRAGGTAELTDIGRFLANAHVFADMPESLPLWTPRVDAFLAGLGLPSGAVHPGFLPPPWPQPTHLAAVEDVEAVPFLRKEGRAGYRAFLGLPYPRVFAISPGGLGSAAQGGFDPLGRALRACEHLGVACAPYAVDGDVVWTGAAPMPQRVAITVAAGRETTLNFAYAVNPDCSRRGVPWLRLVQTPAQGRVEIRVQDGHPGFAAGDTMARCNAATVRGVSLIYVARSGFSGSDAMGFEQIDPDGARHLFALELAVR